MDTMESLVYRLAYWLYDRLSLNWFKRLSNFAEGLCVAGLFTGIGVCTLGANILTDTPDPPWWAAVVFLTGVVISGFLFPLGMIFGDVTERVIADMGQK